MPRQEFVSDSQHRPQWNPAPDRPACRSMPAVSNLLRHSETHRSSPLQCPDTDASGRVDRQQMNVRLHHQAQTATSSPRLTEGLILGKEQEPLPEVCTVFSMIHPKFKV